MSLFEPIKMAFSSIWAHKSRSLLTMLGIIIGVSSVVTLMSVGEGVKKDVASEIEGLGSNLLIIVAGDIGEGGGGFGQSTNVISGDVLKEEDVDAVKKIEEVEKVAPLALTGGTISYGNEQFANFMSVATISEMEGITTFEIGKGDFFKSNDRRNVVVLADTAREEIFGEKEAIGKKISFQDEEYEVIGTLKKISSSDIFSDQSFDSMILFPLEKIKEISGGKADIFRIIAKVGDDYDVKEVAKKVEEKMLKSHNDKKDFSVLTQDDILDLLDTIFGLLTALVTAIAAISLVVGGIGIMNIMLVSVTERTREIGLRKAVGATPVDILRQFLIEAVIITLLGGAIGVLFSYVATSIVRKFSVLDPSITLYAIVLAAGISIAVGIIFGLAPAVTAARKDPIDALRYE